MAKPYKLASREYKNEDTIVEVPNNRGQLIRIGGPRISIIAGPCAVESREQMLEVAQAVAKSGAVMLRGGAYKPRTSPYSFQGLGEEGLKYLREAGDKFGLPIVTEIVDSSLIPIMKNYVDVYQIGARNMQNFELLKHVGILNKPVILKRGLSATIDDLLMAAEYLMASGCERVILCERGIRTFEKATRNTLDLSAIPVLRELTHLPIIVDPSHAVGIRDKIPPMALASIAGGADGIIVEVHCHPEKALSDGPQALLPEQFDKLMRDTEALAPVLGKSIVHIREDFTKEGALLKARDAAVNIAHRVGSAVKSAFSNTPIRVGYNGNRGAFAEQAIMQYFDEDATSTSIKSVSYSSFTDMFSAVTDGKVDFGMVPIENSLAGSVYDNYDNLSRFADVTIVGSVTLNIRHSLLGVKGASLNDIKNVYSHPQALSQCKKFLDNHKEWKLFETSSTSTAAKTVSELDNSSNAAIANRVNSDLYKLDILLDDVEDNSDNYTRFVVITSNNAPARFETSNVTPKMASLIFKTKNEPGSLYRALGVIDKYKLNMSRLESRPIAGEPWRYWFYIDADLTGLCEKVGIADDKKAISDYIKTATEDLKTVTTDIRILGIY